MKKFFLLLIFIFLFFIPNLESAKKKPKQIKSSRPVELIGSKEQRVSQNSRAVGLGIGQFATEDDIKIAAADDFLVELKNSDSYLVDSFRIRFVIKKTKSKKVIRTRIAERKHIYIRPYAEKYLDQLGADYLKKFRKRLKVTSGARSLWLQHEMTQKGSPYHTPYAAKAETPLEESLHVRGAAMDISRAGMSAKEIKWMRERLVKDKKDGVEFEVENQEEPSAIETEPIEEKICYHIVVFPKNKS